MESAKIFKNVNELAGYLHISKNVVLRELNNGTIPGKRIGRRWIVTKDTIDG